MKPKINTCPGFGEDCGDEIPATATLCPSHKRDADRVEEMEAWQRDGHDLFVPYPHLTDR